MKWIGLFLLLWCGVIIALPVGLDVKIYTDPRELTERVPDVYVVGNSTREIPITYFIVAENFGTSSSGACTLRVVLPPPDYVLLPYDRFPVYPPEFNLTYQHDYEYIFTARDIPPGSRYMFRINMTVDATRLPPPMIPTNCITLQADAFLYSRDERESYSDNTSFCRITDDSIFVDLWIRKSVIDSNCATGLITYRLEYGNNGTETCNDVLVWDVLPANASYVSSNPPATILPDRLTWAIPSLSPGSSESIELTISTANIPRPAYFVNTAYIRSSSPELNLSNNQSTLTLFCPETSVVCFDVETGISLYGRPSNLTPGDIVTLQFTVRNRGSVSASDIRVSLSSTPSGIIDLPAPFTIDSLAPGEDTSIYVVDTLSTDCIPALQVIRFVGRAYAYGSGTECDSSDNVSSYFVRYECPSVECPRPAMASTRIITPNGDGHNDYVSFYPAGNVIVKIFSEKGLLVRTLTGNPVWDGRDSNGNALEPGIYIWQMFCPAGSNTPFYTGTIVLKR